MSPKIKISDIHDDRDDDIIELSDEELKVILADDEKHRTYGTYPLRSQRACEGSLCRSTRQVQRQEKAEDSYLL